MAKRLATAWVVIVAIAMAIGGIWSIQHNLTVAIVVMGSCIPLVAIAVLLNKDHRY